MLNIDSFIRSISVKVLDQYFNTVKEVFKEEVGFYFVDAETLKRKGWSEFSECLNSETIAYIQSDFEAIKELSSEMGRLAVLEVVKKQAPRLEEKVTIQSQQSKGHEEFLLNLLVTHPLIFKQAYAIFLQDRTTKALWITETGYKEKHFDLTPSALEELKTGLVEFFKHQGRGQYIEITPVQRPSKEVIHAKISDFVIQSEELTDENRIQSTRRKPILNLFIILDPKTGLLQTSQLKYGRGYTTFLSLICKSLFHMEPLPLRKRQYRLELMLEPNFEFYIPTDSMVKSIEVTGFEFLSLKHGHLLTFNNYHSMFVS